MNSTPSPSPSPILRALSLLLVAEDEFENVAPLWVAPWGRGVFGGALVAHSLIAAQASVPPLLHAHSIHCHFLSISTNASRIRYTVTRTKDGRNFAMRTVHAMQGVGSRCVFTATVSFVRGADHHLALQHAPSPPLDCSPPPPLNVDQDLLTKAGPTGPDRPLDCVRCSTSTLQRRQPSPRRFRHWLRTRGCLDSTVFVGSRSLPHLHVASREHVNVAALAYMTDIYMLGTVYRAHNARRFTSKEFATRMFATAGASSDELAKKREFLQQASLEETSDAGGELDDERSVALLASLDHTVYFHLPPNSYTLDSWMLAEMETSWAGFERGLVQQRIWTHSGQLLATCFQEGKVALSDRGSSVAFFSPL